MSCRPFLARSLAIFLALAGPASVSGGERGHDPRLPRRLSETGLYDAAGAIAPGNEVYVPQYPLWSDGAAKARWIRLPAGSKIDVSDVDAWRFPVGTRFWKEFSWFGRKVETRMLWRTDDGWLFASYVWDDDQSDAQLAPVGGIPAVIEISPGRSHSIPGLADCDACHRSSPATALGFGALQLSDDRDRLAPHAEPLPHDALTLRGLVDSNRLAPPRPELALDPPRIRESSPIARAALGYLSGNCGGCHNRTGPIAHLGLDLLHSEGGAADAPEPVRATAVGAASRFVMPGVPSESCRIVAPGVPDHSALLYRMRSRSPSSQMPPLGTVVADEEAIELVRRWIEELGILDFASIESTRRGSIAAQASPP